MFGGLVMSGSDFFTCSFPTKFKEFMLLHLVHSLCEKE